MYNTYSTIHTEYVHTKLLVHLLLHIRNADVSQLIHHTDARTQVLRSSIHMYNTYMYCTLFRSTYLILSTISIKYQISP